MSFCLGRANQHPPIRKVDVLPAKGCDFRWAAETSVSSQDHCNLNSGAAMPQDVLNVFLRYERLRSYRLPDLDLHGEERVTRAQSLINCGPPEHPGVLDSSSKRLSTD